MDGKIYSSFWFTYEFLISNLELLFEPNFAGIKVIQILKRRIHGKLLFYLPGRKEAKAADVKKVFVERLQKKNIYCPLFA